MHIHTLPVEKCFLLQLNQALSLHKLSMLLGIGEESVPGRPAESPRLQRARLGLRRPRGYVAVLIFHEWH